MNQRKVHPLITYATRPVSTQEASKRVNKPTQAQILIAHNKAIEDVRKAFGGK